MSGSFAGDIAFRRATRSDFPTLARWLAEPHVARWWNHEFTAEGVERDFGASADGTEPSEDHIVLLDGRPIGLIQYSRYTDYPEYLEELSGIVDVPAHAVSIDYLLGEPALIGRGIGVAMIAGFVDRIWDVNDRASCVIVPVSSANTASCRALISAGFELVAHGPLEPDNPIDDPGHDILRLDRPAGR